MTRPRLRAAAFLAVATSAAIAGFIAGRRYPWERLNDLLGRREPVASVTWLPRASIPVARYESSAIVVRGKIYLFGGFHERDIRALDQVDVYDPATDRWSNLGNMPEPLTHRNPVLVGDTIWLAGGFVGDNPGPATDHVWKYVIGTNRWIPGPPLPGPRGGGTLQLLDGRLHYIGGYGLNRDRSEPDHWVFDPSEAGGHWQEAPPLPRPRGHFGAAVKDGALYVVGGTVRHDPVQVDVDWVDRFDSRSGTWQGIAALPQPVSHIEPSTFVWNGELIVAGGRDNTAPNQPQDLILSYDAGLDRWFPRGRLPVRRLGAVALPVGDSLYYGGGTDAGYLARDSRFWSTALPGPWYRLGDLPIPLGEVTAGVSDEEILLIGEGSPLTFRYRIAADRWDAPGTLASRPASGNHHGGEWLAGKWFVIGGLGNSRVGNVIQIYDPATDRWSLGPNLPWRAGSAATAVISGLFYVAGGIDGDTTVGSVARFDPGTGAWSSLAPMPLPRNHAAAGTDGIRWYVFGGRGPGSGNRNEVANGFAETQIYDPQTDRWAVSGQGPNPPAPMPQGRGGTGKAVFVNGEFWVFGGETLDAPGASSLGVYDRVDIYDPVRNSWRPGPPMPTARHGTFPVVVGERIYLLGGGTHAGQGQSSVVEVLDLRPPSPR